MIDILGECYVMSNIRINIKPKMFGIWGSSVWVTSYAPYKQKVKKNRVPHTVASVSEHAASLDV